MKKLFLFFTVVLFVSSAIAQVNAKKVDGLKPVARPKGKPTIEQRAQRSVDNLDKAVTLTADQKTKILALATEHEKKLEAIKGKYIGKESDADKEAAKSELKTAHKEYRTAVKGILTSDQKAILKEKAKEKAKAKEEAKTEKENTKVNNDTEIEELILVE